MNETKRNRIQSAIPKKINQFNKRPNSNFQNPIIQNNINKDNQKKIRPSTTVNRQNYFKNNNIEKIILKKNKVYVEPEKLQTDAFHLVNNLSMIKRENISVKKKLKKIEKENKQIEDFLNENNYIWNNKKEYKESNLLVSLKKILKDLEEEYHKKEKDYTNIKKELKYTKMQEINYEIEELENDGIRLKKILNDIKSKNNPKTKLTQNEEKAIKQKHLIDFLTKEQEQLKVNLSIINNQNEITNNKIENTKIEIKDLEKSLKDLNNYIETEEKKVSILKKKAINFKQSNREKNLNNELDRNKMEKNELENKLQQKELEINDLEKEFLNIQNNFIKKLEEDNKTKIELKKELDDLLPENKRNNDENNNKNLVYINNKKKEYFQYIEIKNIFHEIRLNLIKNNIEFKEINDYIRVNDFNNIMSNNLEIINKLTNFPFSIKGNDAKNIIEYLQNEIMNNETRIKPHQLFFIMIKSYEILSEDDLKSKIDLIFKEYIIMNKKELREFIEIKFEDQNNLTKENFLKMFDDNEIYLKDDDFDYINLFFSNNDINDIDKNKFIEYLIKFN